MFSMFLQELQKHKTSFHTTAEKGKVSDNANKLNRRLIEMTNCRMNAPEVKNRICYCWRFIFKGFNDDGEA